MTTAPTTGTVTAAALVAGVGAALWLGIKNDSYVFAGVIATLEAGLVARSVQGVTVQQWYQPRVQGAPTGMAMLLSTVTTHDYGFLGRDDKWNAAQTQMTHTEKQVQEMHIQLTGWSPAPPSPKPLLPMTTGDLAKLGARILQSDAGRCQLRALGLNLLRITDVRQPYGKDETDQFIGASSFDFVLALNQVEKTTTPIVTDEVLRISRV